MKIGITIPYASVNYSGGLNVQCRMWYDGLTELGHDVNLLNPWDYFEYDKFDYIIIVGFGKLLIDYVRLFKQYDKPKLISAPVLDPNTMSIRHFHLSCKYNGSVRFGINRPFHDYYKCKNDFVFFLVRSEFEKEYIVKGLEVEPSKVKIVPISVRLKSEPLFDLSKKENTCLHVSRLASGAKNVPRLIEAAKKYSFNLVLAGTVHGKKEMEWLNKQIAGSSNIKYIGWLDEESLIEEYKKAKVLALPSIIEGVGMVALEAASYGCEICLTNLGGPKEYYDGRAVLVNPYDVDSIGKGVLEAMNCKNAQPELSQYIQENYSLAGCMKRLESYMNEAFNKE